MAIYEEISESKLFSAFDSFAKRLSQISIVFSNLNTFETEKTIVLWAEPEISADLIAPHHEIHSLLDPDLCEQHYRPENWIPHCTLATEIDVSRKDEVQTLIADSIEPIVGLFDVIDCVSIFPVEVIREKKLQCTL